MVILTDSFNDLNFTLVTLSLFLCKKNEDVLEKRKDSYYISFTKIAPPMFFFVCHLETPRIHWPCGSNYQEDEEMEVSDDVYLASQKNNEASNRVVTEARSIRFRSM